MIYKNNFIIITVICVLLAAPCFAVEKGFIKYDDEIIDYSVLNDEKIRTDADYFWDIYEQTKDKKYLGTAMGKYYILTQIHPVEIYPMVQLARTYDEKHLDKFAKEYFNTGLNINKYDPYLNYYFGDFYYKRADYKRALRHFKIAYRNGYTEYYDLNYKIATIYEKFADLLNAKYYYERAYSINSNNSFLKDKVLQIDSLNYEQSEYYIRK